MLRSLAAWRSFNWLKKGRLDPLGVANFLIFDERMPRSISFCYKEIRSNLADLSNFYGRDYKSLDMADKVCMALADDRSKNMQTVNLREFITAFVAKNNLLSLTIADDFNLN